MRTFLVLICSLALACAAGGEQEENKSKKPAPKKEEPQGTILDPQLKSAQGVVAATPSPHGFIGRNDGRVQQSGKPLSTPSPRNLTTNAKAPQQATAHHVSGSYSARVGSTALDKPTFGEKFKMSQTQHDPSTKTKQKTKGSQQITTQGTAHRNNSRAGMGKATTVGKSTSFA